MEFIDNRIFISVQLKHERITTIKRKNVTDFYNPVHQMNVYNEHTGMQQPNYLSFSGGMEAFNLQGGFGEAYCPTDMSPPMLFNPHYVPGYVTTSVGPCFPTHPTSIRKFENNTDILIHFTKTLCIGSSPLCRTLDLAVKENQSAVALKGEQGVVMCCECQLILARR
ncbi:uncharacterized protein TRIADDRAFT_54857 [Trichoplax adhaerens]|uniref:Uncharacterized protein n=1 Tax=Trichoplax adhaerens TaxID=10228 RepID=B3RT68_TRIAD|nr:predicted protein [Trichoplax adhaerens]EDV26645.1 predicted protein [Trichoplax adhaerens]|eukprot:XP_002110641.1 predicted protein [Trichoplax adhaerens]